MLLLLTAIILIVANNQQNKTKVSDISCQTIRFFNFLATTLLKRYVPTVNEMCSFTPDAVPRGAATQRTAPHPTRTNRNADEQIPTTNRRRINVNPFQSHSHFTRTIFIP